MNKTFIRLEDRIKLLEKNYIDPDTARKVGTLKQQFKIQREKRKNLLETIKNSIDENNESN